MPTAAESKALAERVFGEVFTAGNMALVNELFTSDHAYRDPDNLWVSAGPEGVARAAGFFQSGFPGATFTVEDSIVAGNQIAVLLTLSGTHAGSFIGIPPTGNSVNVRGIAFLTILDGKVAETWFLLDWLSLITQLQAVATPVAA